jgi:transcriptional regulator with XRE-family HTH domain
MANITMDELRAKYPPEDRNEYDRAYAAATLAGQLAELICALRTRAALTQTELARRMGTTQSSIARIEGGGSLPTLNMLARLAHATGIPLRLAAPESPTSTSADPPDQIPRPGCDPHEPSRPAFPAPAHGAVAGCRRLPTAVWQGKKERHRYLFWLTRTRPCSR